MAEIPTINQAVQSLMEAVSTVKEDCLMAAPATAQMPIPERFARQPIHAHGCVVFVISDPQTKPAKRTADPQTVSLTKRERTTLLNIVAAQLELLQAPRPGRVSDAAVIAELVANYGDKPGIATSTLEGKFSEAKRSLAAS